MRVRFWQEVQGPDDALAALEALVYRNLQQLKRTGPVPDLYASRVRYVRAPREAHWKTVREVLRDRSGDCEDLSAYRVAQLRATGRDRHASCAIRAGGRPGLWHVVVRRGDGSLEDPSAVLGMRQRRRKQRG